MLTLNPRTLFFLLLVLAIATTSGLVAAEKEKTPTAGQSAQSQSDEDADNQRRPRGWRGTRRVEPPMQLPAGAYGTVIRFMGEMGREVQRIEDMEDAFEERIAAWEEKNDLTEEDKARRLRIIELRRELIQLDKDDFVARFQRGLSHGVKSMGKELETRDQALPGRERLQRFHERLDTLQENADDFESISKFFREQHEAWRLQFQGAPEREDLRLERLSREINMLRHRLGRLQEEFERLRENEADSTPED